MSASGLEHVFCRVVRTIQGECPLDRSRETFRISEPQGSKTGNECKSSTKERGPAIFVLVAPYRRFVQSVTDVTPRASRSRLVSYADKTVVLRVQEQPNRQQGGQDDCERVLRLA